MPHAALEGSVDPLLPGAGQHSSNGDLDTLFAALAVNTDLTHDDLAVAGLGVWVHAD